MRVDFVYTKSRVYILEWRNRRSYLRVGFTKVYIVPEKFVQLTHDTACAVSRLITVALLA